MDKKGLPAERSAPGRRPTVVPPLLNADSHDARMTPPRPPDTTITPARASSAPTAEARSSSVSVASLAPITATYRLSTRRLSCVGALFVAHGVDDCGAGYADLPSTVGPETQAYTDPGGPDDTCGVGPRDQRRGGARLTGVRPTWAGAVLLRAWFRPDHDV